MAFVLLGRHIVGVGYLHPQGQTVTVHLKGCRIPAIETPEKEVIMPITVRQSGGWFDPHRKVGIVFVEDVN